MRFRVLSVVLPVVVASACGTPGKTDIAADASRIAMLEQQTIRDLAARRMDAVSGLYARDARILPANAPAVRGHDSIAAVFRELATSFPRFRHEFRVDSVVVARSGDVAAVTGVYRFTADTLHPMAFDVGKYLGIWTPKKATGACESTGPTATARGAPRRSAMRPRCAKRSRRTCMASNSTTSKACGGRSGPTPDCSLSIRMATWAS